MDQFFTIRFRRNTAQRFKKFSKQFAKSYSEGIDLMMDFFEWHGFRPNQRFGKSLMQEILKNRKRTEANIAILRDIEQTQTKPLSIQMDLLFEGHTQQRERPKRVEKIFADKESNGEENFIRDPLVPKVELDRAKSDLEELRTDLAYVLDRVKIVKSTLGKDYLRLDMEPTRFETLKATVERKRV